MSSDFSDIRPPLTNEAVQRLTPELHRIAAGFARNSVDRDDYVQQALLRLASRDDWTNPLVVARSVFLNYAKSLSTNTAEPVPFFDDGCGMMPFGREQEPVDGVILQSMQRFEGLGLGAGYRRVAELYWVEHWTIKEIAGHLKIDKREVGRRLNRVREAIRENWLTQDE